MSTQFMMTKKQVEETIKDLKKSKSGVMTQDFGKHTIFFCTNKFMKRESATVPILVKDGQQVSHLVSAKMLKELLSTDGANYCVFTDFKTTEVIGTLSIGDQK